MSFVVAIDGPAGTGKGTITKLISQELGLLNVDTGALYRCVALEALNRKIDLNETQTIIDLVSEIKMDIRNNEGEQTIFLNDIDVSEKIRNAEVTKAVTPVSAISGVREKITKIEIYFSKNADIIIEGRDIGTVVFPNADIKIYLDATVEERANRRLNQNKEKGIESSYEEILESIKRRDEGDKTRPVGALKVADNAVIIDTTNMSIEEVTNKVKEIILTKYEIKKKQNKPLTKKQERIKKKINRRYSYKDTKFKLFQRKIIKSIFWVVYRILFRIEVRGEKVPDDKAYILCGNHVSFLDPPAVIMTQKRHVNMMAKEEILKSNILYWWGYIFNCIPVKRGTQDIDSIKRCLEVLKNNGLVGIYPEGTRNGLKKNNGKVKNGASFIAVHTGVSVIPIGIIGNFKPFKKVIINIGKPLDFSKYQTKKPEKEVLEKVSDEIMDNIIRLTNEKI